MKVKQIEGKDVLNNIQSREYCRMSKQSDKDVFNIKRLSEMTIAELLKAVENNDTFLEIKQEE